MALLKIVKDGKALIIPQGAYRTQYAPAGWVVEEPDGLKKTSKDAEVGDTEATGTEQQTAPQTMPQRVTQMSSMTLMRMKTMTTIPCLRKPR